MNAVPDQSTTSGAAPKQSEDPDNSREYARVWYWSEHDYEEYECPDCGRGADRVYQFDVHHRDGEPTNNDPSNLIGLCHRCHIWRHRRGRTMSGLDLREWQNAFIQSTDSDSTNRNVIHE